MRDVTVNELDKVWSTAELESLPRGETYWNPFAILMQAGNERARKLGKAWVELHDGHQDGPPPMMKDATDGLANMRSAAALRLSGLRVAYGEDGEVATVFPKRSAAPTVGEVDAWEQRCIAMHQDQPHIDPDDLPRHRADEPGRPTFHEMLRDKHNGKQDGVVNFEDLTPEERNSFLKRSDS